MRNVVFVRALLLALLVVGVVMATPAKSSAQIGISVSFGPPALPVYDQPICPGDGYIWTPGYWAWDPDAEDYYWVPGTWVEAPEVGYLWTPPWWGWDGGVYLFHEGYWGPHIGFYGGINYGFGYFGEGFVGGRWDGGHFFYNRSVTNINIVNIHNVYEERVNVRENRISYNGGAGGISARPRPEDEMAARDRHIGAVGVQSQHIQEARGNRELRASVNQGRPPIAATARPNEFRGGGAVSAREAGAPYRAPERGSNARPAPGGGNPPSGARTFTHPNELPAPERHAPNTGSPSLDRKYQQQQDKMFAKQQQQRQQLQQKQEQEHQRMQSAPPQRQQQMEQRHAQQTQQLQQRHTQQQQQMQQRQSAPPHKR